MALIKPFISTIPSFNATNGTSGTINVIGGDLVETYQYWIYLQGSETPIYTSAILTPSTPDIRTNTIRQFPFTIPTNNISGLVNNNSYYIVGRTYNSTLSDYTYSPLSSQELFTCYVSPSFTTQIYNGTQYVNLTSGSTINASSANIQLVFNTNDINSPATLNSAIITLYGIDINGNENLIYTSRNIYNAPLQDTIKGLLPTVDSQGQPLADRLYTSYTLKSNGVTVGGFEFQNTINNLNCYYSISSSSLDFEVSNLCSQGLVKIQSSLTSVAQNVNTLVVEYKATTDTAWITLQTLTKPLEDINWTNFYFYFSYCQNNKSYDFRMTLYDTNGGQVQSYTQTIISYFTKAYICDSNNIFNITNELEFANIRTVQKSAMYEPYGRTKPFISYNAKTQYRNGSSTAVLLAPTSQSETSSYIDKYAQVQLINSFNNFLTNRRGKILKDYNGNLRVVAVYNDISNNYYKELGNAIASSSFEWAEISDISQDGLAKIGMLNQFVINYIN